MVLHAVTCALHREESIYICCCFLEFIPTKTLSPSVKSQLGSGVSWTRRLGSGILDLCDGPQRDLLAMTLTSLETDRQSEFLGFECFGTGIRIPSSI